jgi:ATP-dependent exoDNAse (exonuclease V) alpha subunit
MIGCNLLLEIHEALCEAKENADLFGGLNIIFVGDFAQLPPVGDTKLYSHIKTERTGTTRGQKNVFGKLLWLSVDKVIILKELMRQNTQEDTQFTELLARLRVGSCTHADYDFLNAKLLRNTKTDFSDPIWMNAPILVSNNDVKDSLNIACARSFAARTKQPLHFYYATDKRKGKPISDRDLQQKLWSYHSGKTEQRIGVLPLCKGMPVMITQNYDVENGIVNGCLGTLEKVNYTLDEQGFRHAHSCVLRTEATSGPCLPHLNEHEVVVLKDETHLTFTHPYSHIRSTFQRAQLPITPAFALTAHKSQGNTLPSAILDLESCLTTEAVYVMLSRVKKSDNIRILRPFRLSKITTRTSEDLRKEFHRFEFLHEQTLNASTPVPRPSINSNFGGARDLEKIENWYKQIVDAATWPTST